MLAQESMRKIKKYRHSLMEERMQTSRFEKENRGKAYLANFLNLRTSG